MSQQPPVDALLPLKEAVRQSGLSKSELYRWMREGHPKFPRPYYLGTSVRWSEREVQAWVADVKASQRLAS